MAWKSFFSQVEEQMVQELPLVIYRKPEASKIVALLQKNDKLHTGWEPDRPGFLFSAFNPQTEPVLIPLDSSEKLELELSSDRNSGNPENAFSRSNSSVALENREAKLQHLDLISRALKVLETGGLKKVVVSRKENVQLPEKSPFLLFQDLLASYPSAFVYLWFHPKQGLWLGATPETLLQMDGLSFRTMALAATQKYTGKLEVEWSKKEKQEQQFVTDSIVESLEELGIVEEIKLTEPYTSKAGGLVHIRTDITGKLSSATSLREIVKALHPTPAVCGLPKDKAMEFIVKEEGYDREYYTGFLGELNFREHRHRSANRRNTENQVYRYVRSKSSLYVNLRCMKIAGGQAELFVGGGITSSSDPEAEWQETVNKSQTMKKVISR